MEMIVRKPHSKSKVIPPPLTPGLERVDKMIILGVLVSNMLTVSCHVERCVVRASQSMYALQLLRSHGLCGKPLYEVTRATLVAQMVYASPSWSGLMDAEGSAQFQGVLKKAIRWGLLKREFPSFKELCDKTDQQLFSTIQDNENHVLHCLLPKKFSGHNLRQRSHNFIIPRYNNTLLRKNIY